MKNFENPEIEIEVFQVADVLTTSDEDWGMGEV